MMSASEFRLLIEVVLVTLALTVGGGVSLWGFVQMRRRTPDTVAHLEASNSDMARRLRALEKRQEQYHADQLRMQTRLEIQSEYSRRLADYARMLADRLRGLGETNIPPAPAPPDYDLRGATAPDNKALPLILAALFNLDELEDLILRLGIAAADIPGDTLRRRCRELVAYCDRHSRSDELIALARQLRPEGDF